MLSSSAVSIATQTPPPKISNQEKRSREHLFPTEVVAMISAAKKFGRHKLRDSTLILMAYRHGLRVSELVALKWEQIDFAGGRNYLLDDFKIFGWINCEVSDRP